MPKDYSITQNIPVAAHVYKYLKKRCGSDHIKASRTTFMGSQILSLLQRNPDVRPRKTDFGHIFKVTISESHWGKNGMHISGENAQLFNDHIDKMFREELYVHMLMLKCQEKKLYLNSMRSFIEVYGIDEEDIKIDTLYRDFKRKKESLETNLNITPTSGTI